MKKEQTAVFEHLELLKKLFPQFTRAFESCREDIEDQSVLTGPPVKRVLIAVREGCQLQAEIRRRTGLEEPDLGDLLRRMVETGVLSVQDQGGKTEGARGARKKLFFLVEQPVAA